MSTAAPRQIPQGYSPPFATVTPTDHEAWILISAALNMACFLFFGFIRVSLRTILQRGFGTDDYTCFAAMMLAVIQTSIVLAACAKGLGKAVDLVSPHDQENVLHQQYFLYHGCRPVQDLGHLLARPNLADKKA